MSGERILLDTNVLSEITNPSPAAQVVAFVSELQDPLVSAAVFHELAYGAARLPDGKRKLRFQMEISLFRIRFEKRIIPIEFEVAQISGELRAKAQGLGRDLKPMDSLMAATAIFAGAKLATRNIRDFEVLGMDLVNPWTHPD